MLKAIGISGVAGSGKDTFYLLLQEAIKKCNLNIRVERLALADLLKADMRDFLFKEFNIDILNPKTPRKDKETIRELLVVFGKIKRKLSNGKYFTDRIYNRCQTLMKNGIIPVITDIRYDEYPEDELWFIKEKLGGILIHIAMFKPDKTVVAPANKDEEVNDPKLIRGSDFSMIWDSFYEGGCINKEIYNNCLEDIQNFIKKHV